MNGKKGMQGTNYYSNEETEKFRYNPYRLRNRQLAELYYGNNKILPFPLHVIIETSSLCNLKCEFCNREVMKRPQQNMNMEVFKKIVDECAENEVYSLSLYCLGEPMLNKQIRNMIIYAKRMGIPYVDLSTNGTYDLYNLLGTGLNELIINDYTNDVEIAKSFVYERNIRGDCLPVVRLQLIDLPKYKERNEKIIKNNNNIFDVIYLKNIEVFSQSLGDKHLPKEEIVTRLSTRIPCKQLWFVMTVNSDGTIASCCHDPMGKSIMGNINNESIRSCWNKMSDIRERHRKGNHSDFNGLCENCVDYNW